MQITHIALWVTNLEESKHFFEKFFDGKSDIKYHNKKTNFQSYFIKFQNGPKSVTTISNGGLITAL